MDWICGQIASITEAGPYAKDSQSGYVEIMMGFDNPGLPVDVDWTMTAETNLTAGMIPGFLIATIPHGNSELNFSFYVQPWTGNGTIEHVVSFTKYSALYNFVSDPRIFPQSFDTSVPIHDYRKVNDTASFMPIAIAYFFYEQTGSYPRAVLSSGTFQPSCRSLLTAEGFSV